MAIRIDPHSIDAYVGRARAHDLRGERDAAIRDFLKAAELAPSGGAGFRAQADRVRQSD
jgi:Tfp pilus assembly protein PilF